MLKKYFFSATLAIVVILIASLVFAEPPKKKSSLINDGGFVSMKAELTKSGNRPAFKALDGLCKGQTLVILENANLERLEKIIKDQKLTTVDVECEVTKYGNTNYLILTSYVDPQEEKQEQPGDDSEEKDDEDSEDE